jgi:thymidylate synthase
MANDAPAFSFIHEMMFLTLKEIYPNLKYGTYFHVADSFHVYERHFKLLDQILSSTEIEEVDCPKMSSAEEVRFLRKLDFSNVPDEFKFVKWLIEEKE